MNRRNRGKVYENKAKEYLINNGYEVLGENVYQGHYELDLIALKEGVLIFVEVKYRKKKEGFNVFSSVSALKRNNIIKAARMFLQNHLEFRNALARFDVIVFTGETNGEGEVHHIKSAFRN